MMRKAVSIYSTSASVQRLLYILLEVYKLEKVESAIEKEKETEQNAA